MAWPAPPNLCRVRPASRSGQVEFEILFLIQPFGCRAVERTQRCVLGPASGVDVVNGAVLYPHQDGRVPRTVVHSERENRLLAGSRRLCGMVLMHAACAISGGCGAGTGICIGCSMMMLGAPPYPYP